MGIIDKVHISLTCQNCNITEENSAPDKGSMYSGSDWRKLSPFKNFDGELTGGFREEPGISDATCKACGGKAEKKTWHTV